MTYPPGGPGYPSPPHAQYSAPTQQFDRLPDSGPASPAADSSGSAGASKLPVYLGSAVAVLGFALYLTSFGPLFGDGSLPATLLVVPPVLAGLLAGVGLLPKQDDRSAVAAVLAVLGFLLLILVVLGEGTGIGWGFYPFVAFSVLQAIAAVGKLLLDAGVITAPAPRPEYQQQPYGGYGAPSPYYGQPGGPGPQQPGYPPQYGGYQGGFNTGGFPALGRPGGPQGPQSPGGPGNGGHQSGPPTPPTGFPAFGQPQSAAAPPSASASSPETQALDAQHTQVAHQQAPQETAPPPS